jgi:hypothetical protein
MTNQVKITQGKWVISHGANFIPSIGSAELHQPIAHLCNMTDAKQFCEEAEANAKLIAAAPDMLKALARVENHLRDVSTFRVLTPAELDVLETVIKAYDKATK